VSPARQEERHACLRLAPIQEDQPRYVQCDKGDSGWAAHPAYAETTQHEGSLGGQRTGGTIQSGRHGETSAGYGWFGQTASYPVVASLGFRTDESPYCVSPVIKRAGCDERAIYRSHPFLVKDVLFSAILVAANDALLEIAKVVEAPDEERELVNDWAARGRKGLEKCWDDKLNLCLDYDLRADRSLRVRTVAGFAPLIAGRQSPELLAALLGELDSPAFAGHSELRWPVPPSTSPEERGFHPRSYWRGPVWPVANWLLWWSLIRAGETERAAQIRRASLDQIAEGGFAEYFEPFSGEPLGSGEQSWTAAVVLDWLADDVRSAEIEAA